MDSCPNSAHAQEAQFIESVSVFGPRPKWLRCVLRGLYLGSRSPWNTWVLFGFYVASIWAMFGFLFGVFGFLVSTFYDSIYVGSIIYICGFYNWSLHGLVS